MVVFVARRRRMTPPPVPRERGATVARLGGGKAPKDVQQRLGNHRDGRGGSPFGHQQPVERGAMEQDRRPVPGIRRREWKWCSFSYSQRSPRSSSSNSRI